MNQPISPKFLADSESEVSRASSGNFSPFLARAKKGEKFPELARDTSDAESAKNFGEIGWFKKSDLNPSLQHLFKEKRGYLTDVMKTENGFVIFKLEERHEEGLAPFEEVENEITEKLYVPRMQPKVREFLTKLREQAFLEIREGYVDSGAAPLSTYPSRISRKACSRSLVRNSRTLGCIRGT